MNRLLLFPVVVLLLVRGLIRGHAQDDFEDDNVDDDDDDDDGGDDEHDGFDEDEVDQDGQDEVRFDFGACNKSLFALCFAVVLLLDGHLFCCLSKHVDSVCLFVLFCFVFLFAIARRWRRQSSETEEEETGNTVLHNFVESHSWFLFFTV